VFFKCSAWSQALVEDLEDLEEGSDVVPQSVGWELGCRQGKDKEEEG